MDRRIFYESRGKDDGETAGDIDYWVEKSDGKRSGRENPDSN